MRYFIRPDGRYYLIMDSAPDLFGDPVIQTFHGSKHNLRGGAFTYLETSTSMEAIIRTRMSHGYTEMAWPGR